MCLLSTVPSFLSWIHLHRYIRMSYRSWTVVNLQIWTKGNSCISITTTATTTSVDVHSNKQWTFRVWTDKFCGYIQRLLEQSLNNQVLISVHSTKTKPWIIDFYVTAIFKRFTILLFLFLWVHFILYQILYFHDRRSSSLVIFSNKAKATTSEVKSKRNNSYQYMYLQVFFIPISCRI